MKKSKFKQKKKSKLLNLGRKNLFILLSFIISFVIINLVYICFNIIPFGNNTVLRMDLYHQYGPLFAELHDRLSDGASLLYSWNSGCGSSFLGNFYNYLSSPLSLLVLLFGHQNNPEAISFLIALKVSLASTFFCFYLKHSKEFSKNNCTSVAFSVLYSFCGYFVAYYWNLMWLDAFMLLPLVVLGIERIINDKKCLLYIISLSITIFSNYYLGYMICIFSVMYAIMYYFGKYSFNSKYVQLNKDIKISLIKKITNLRLPVSITKFIISSLSAVLLCAFSLLPLYFILQNSSATSGEFPQDCNTYFKTFDFLVNHFAGLDPTIRSSGDNVLPNIYCGVITLLLSLLYLFIKSISIKEKVTRILMLIFLYFSFNLNILNYIWHGFHFPNDLPYRQSFLYSFIILTIAYKALLRINEITNKDIVKIGIGVLTFIIIAEKIGSKNIIESTILISGIFIIIYTLILILFNKFKLQKFVMSTILLCCVIIEILVANTDNYVMDQKKVNYTGDYSSFQQVKQEISKNEKSPFYRMELTDLNTRMDPCWFGYNGISIFSSMAYEKVANLQYNLGMFGNYINSYTYFMQTPIYNSMFGIKYVIDNTNDKKFNQELYTKIKTINKYKIYKYNYSLPVAFCSNFELQQWSPTNSNPFVNQNNFIYYSTGIDDVLSSLFVNDIEYNNINDFGDNLNSGNYSYYKTYNDSSASFTMNYVLDRKQNVYIYVKSDNIDKNTITVRADGCDICNQNINEEYILDCGVWEEGTVISIDIPIKDNKNSGNVDCNAYGLDISKFKNAYKILNNSSMKITQFKESNFKGTINAKKAGILCTSIPYDTSWKVYVDGMQVDDKDIKKIGDSLLGVTMSKGKHELEFKYVPKGLFAGALISILVLICLIILKIYRRSIKKYN